MIIAMKPAITHTFYPGDIAYFGHLYIGEGGSVQYCNVRRVEILQTPSLRDVDPHHVGREIGLANGRRKRTYRSDALHATEDEAKEILRARLKGRISKLQKALEALG